MQIVVAALGDSITAGTPRWDPDPDVRRTVPESVLDERHQWPYWAERADERLVVRNHGANRERTDEIARRMDIASVGAGAIVVQGGINDLVQGRRPESAAKNLRAMVSRGKKLVPRVVVVDVLPWNNGYPEQDARIRTLNELIRRLAADEGVPLLPFYATLEDPERTGRMKDEWTSDGNHPSLDGHRRLGGLLSLVSWT